MYPSSGVDPSNFVSSFNVAFYFIVIISVIFIVALTALMIYFVVRYNKKRNAAATQIEGSTKLEILWTVIPILLALAMFHYGWIGWKPLNKAPADALNITGIARMWNFLFVYENGKESPELVIPVNKAVKIDLVSLDVNHSLFIPAFRIKSDMVPGLKKMMWFFPQREGQYDLYCAEYCGLQHSSMSSVVKVLTKEEFNTWYSDSTTVTAKIPGTEPGSEGLAVIQKNGCTACHSTDGSKIVGPSFQGLFGKQHVVVRDGKEVTVTADEEYIKRSIYDPGAEIVQGYPKGLMQSYEGTISADDLAKIIEFLKTLNGK
jgi:cytochrome c oxidase subunit 2